MRSHGALVLLSLVLVFPAVAASRRPVAAHPEYCGELPAAPASSPYAVRYDQLGYLTNGELWTVVLSDGRTAPRYRIYRAGSNCLVASGTAGPRVINTVSRAGSPLTGDRIDLSAITKPGSYLIVLDDGSRFGPFAVGANVYDAALPAMLNFLAVQRCGPTTADVSLHGACHLFSSITDNDVRTSSGDGISVPYGSRDYVTTSTGPAVNVEGGWHDAGDFLKFPTTGSFTVALQLLALREHPAFFAKRGLTTPMKTELRWELDWLTKMIDREEPFVQVGGVGDHDRERMPEADTATPLLTYQQRPAVRFRAGAGRNILARSAAAFAIAAEVFHDGDPAYAQQLHALAVRAYDRAVARPAAQPTDPDDWYDEPTTDDDMTFAAAELYRITAAQKYRNDALTYGRKLLDTGVPVMWYDLSPLALSEAALAFPDGSVERLELTQILIATTAEIVETNTRPTGNAAGFRYALPSLGNGSMGEGLGAAVTALALNRVVPSHDAAEVARTQLHWLFGQNPFGLSFMIGVGKAWPQKPQHEVAHFTGKRLDGAVVGGPTATRELDARPLRGAFAKWSTDAVYFEDNEEEYVTNEPAIDYLAALPFLIAELELE